MATILDEYYPNLNYHSESLKFAKFAKAIKNNYNKTFYKNDIKRYVDGLNSKHAAMHSSFMPIVFDLVKEKHEDDIANFLLSRGMDCGVFGSQFFLWSLYKLNLGEKALELIVSKDNNSWYNMIYNLQAANTCEAWNPSGKPDMSKSHSWGSSAGNMIQRGLMGINPIEPGFKKISIKPQIGDLKYAKMDLPTIKGNVSVKVSIDSILYNVSINMPANTFAKVFIQNFGNINTKVEVDGIITKGILDQDGEYIIFDNIGSGYHTFKRVLM
jgi:hypothetical protein